MIITQEFEVRASRQALWNLLTDVNRVAGCMPGVEKVEQIDEQTYQAQMSVKVGPIKASFSGDVIFVETRPPEKMRIKAIWKEHYTSSKAEVLGDVELQELEDGWVKCQVNVEASVLGPLGKYGQGVAQKKADEINKSFAACVSAVLEQETAPLLLPAGTAAPAVVSKSFEYLRPTTLDEAVGLLQEYGDEAKVMAGGQSLVLLMREGLVKPGVIIDVMGISGLNDIHAAETNGHVKIGALATHRQVEISAMIQKDFPFLPEAYRNLGNVQVRNMATLGGNLCHNAPGSDPPPLLMALDGTVTLHGPAGKRSITIEDFGVDFFETALKEDEILTHVRLPLIPPRSGIAYYKYAARPMDMAIVGVAARITLDPDGEKCQDVRLVLGGIAPTTIRACRAEAVLQGENISEQLIIEAAEIAMGEIDPISDVHASAAYRRQLTPVAVRRMVSLAWQRAQAA